MLEDFNDGKNNKKIFSFREKNLIVHKDQKYIFSKKRMSGSTCGQGSIMPGPLDVVDGQFGASEARKLERFKLLHRINWPQFHRILRVWNRI